MVMMTIMMKILMTTRDYPVKLLKEALTGNRSKDFT